MTRRTVTMGCQMLTELVIGNVASLFEATHASADFNTCAPIVVCDVIEVAGVNDLLGCDAKSCVFAFVHG